MHKKNFGLLVVLLLSAFNLSAQGGDAIIGQWRDVSHPEQEVEIYNERGKYFGRDGENSAKLVLKDLEWLPGSGTYRGVVVDPSNGREMTIDLKMVDQNNFQFQVGIFLFKKTIRFRRV